MSQKRMNKTSLAKMLYRAECPQAIELGEYQLGLLDKMRTAFVRSHLAECPHCTRELAQLDGYLDAVSAQLPASATPPTFGEQVQLFIGKLVRPNTPRLVLRGDETDTPLLYETDDMQVTLDVQADDAHAGQKVISGLLMTDSAAPWQAHLWQGNTRLAQAGVDEFGNFAFENISTGTHHLILSQATSEIHLEVEL